MEKAVKQLLLILLVAALPGIGRGEAVFVDAGFGEVGNAWLFGSRRDQSCWVALPWHVVAAMTADEAGPFFFTDQSGRVGEAGAPFRVSRNQQALRATNGNDDLAFAPVTAGVTPGTCNSRLGLPEGGFAVALQTTPRLAVYAMQETTVITFEVRLSRISADAGRGSTFLVEPANPEDRRFLQGGLSGGTVLMDWQGSLQPAGMVLSVLAGQDAAVVLRFDRLRQAFEVIEAAPATDTAEPDPAKVEAPGGVIAVLGVRGVIAAGSTPLSGIVAQDGCWRASPHERERSIEIVLSATGLRPSEARSLLLVADPACGPPETYVVEARQASGDWVTISTACSSGPAGAQPCRLPRKPDLELRLRSSPRQGWLGLSRIVLQ